MRGDGEVERKPARAVAGGGQRVRGEELGEDVGESEFRGFVQWRAPAVIRRGGVGAGGEEARDDFGSRGKHGELQQVGATGTASLQVGMLF